MIMVMMVMVIIRMVMMVIRMVMGGSADGNGISGGGDTAHMWAEMLGVHRAKE